MALIGINPGGPAPERKPSTLEQIAMGVQIAANVLGTGLKAYEVFGIAKPQADAEVRLKNAQAADAGGDRALDRKLKESQIQYYGASRPIELEKSKKELENLNKAKIPSFYEGALTENLKKANELETSAKILEEQLNIFDDKNRSEDERIQAGRSAYKKLNDPVNSDAVSMDEAKRVGALLEYKIGNMTGPGSFVGRDLDLFSKQMKNAIVTIKNTAKFKRSSADDILKAYHVDVPKIGEQPLDSESKQALEWANANPEDPRAAEIKKRLGVK